MNPDKLTISQLLKRMTIPQVWALATCLCALAAGTFAIGYNWQGRISMAQIAAKDLEIKSLAATLDLEKSKHSETDKAVKASRIKERFLSLYVRYLSTGYGDMDKKKEARKALDDFISTYDDKEVISLGKGGTKTTVKMPDGSVWEVPPDLMSVTKK